MDIIKLTAVQLALSFHSTGAWTGYNNGDDQIPTLGFNNVDVGSFANRGAPLLGEISPGGNLNVQYFSANDEVAAIMSPCIDGIQSVFDFKRDMQGFFLSISMNANVVGASMNPLLQCPSPSWCDDDVLAPGGAPYNIDEDIMLDPSPACSLFSIDQVTIGGIDGNGSLACSDQAVALGSVGLNAKNMREWLNMDGYRVSDTKEWFARVEIGCVPDGNGQMVWAQTSHFVHEPKIGEGNPAFPVIGFGGYIQEQPKINNNNIDNSYIKSMIADIQSTSPSRRASAMAALSAVIQNQALSEQQIEYVVKMCVHIMESKNINRREEPVMFNPRYVTTILLGQIGDSESINALVNNITVLTPEMVQTMARGLKNNMTIAAQTLSNIGSPAIGPILSHMKTANDPTWAAMSAVMRQIDYKSPIVRQAMRTYLDAETGPGAPPAVTDEEKAQRLLLKTRLEKFLATPEPRRPKPKPVAGDASGSTGVSSLMTASR